MSEELKPCPFCGGKATMSDDAPFQVECGACGCRSGMGCVSAAGAAHDWNTRPAPAVQVPEGMALAYGLLWHVNAGMDAPGIVPSMTPEKAAHEARKALRDLMTKEQRGDGINAARAMLAAAPKGEK